MTDIVDCDRVEEIKNTIGNLGIEVWRADKYTTFTLSVSSETAEKLDNEELLDKVTQEIADAHQVHPSWVEYDESVPEFKIQLEWELYTKF